MLFRFFAIASALWLSFGSGTAETMPSMMDPKTEARLESTYQFELNSRVSGERYDVRIFVPEGTPPTAGGYPILYILDGDALFGPYAMAMAIRGGVGELTPAVVVGISGAVGPGGAHRSFDYSSSKLTSQEQKIIKDFGPGARLGGADQFFRILSEEIRPQVDRVVHVDERRSTLLGWSLAGHFVTYAMLEHPEAFSAYIALSPSLWLGGRRLFGEVTKFEQSARRLGKLPNYMIGVGSLESRTDKKGFAGRIDAAEFNREMTYTAMVSNVEEFYQKLRPVYFVAKSKITERIYVGDTHNSEPFSAVNSTLDFAYKK